MCVGGTHTATDTAKVAEYVPECKIVAIPATIDGDFRNAYVPMSLGFDTASRVMSQLVGNIATDCASARKYYYFVRLMGRTPSNLALEVALNTCPNSVLIGEHVQDSN